MGLGVALGGCTLCRSVIPGLTWGLQHSKYELRISWKTLTTSTSFHSYIAEDVRCKTSEIPLNSGMSVCTRFLKTHAWELVLLVLALGARCWSIGCNVLRGTRDKPQIRPCSCLTALGARHVVFGPLSSCLCTICTVRFHWLKGSWLPFNAYLLHDK